MKIFTLRLRTLLLAAVAVAAFFGAATADNYEENIWGDGLTTRAKEVRYGVSAGWASFVSDYYSGGGFRIGGSAVLPLYGQEVTHVYYLHGDASKAGRPKKYLYLHSINPSLSFVGLFGDDDYYDYYDYYYSSSYYRYKMSAYYLETVIPYSFKRYYTNFSIGIDIGLYFSVGLFGKQQAYTEDSLLGERIIAEGSSYSEQGRRMPRVMWGFSYGLCNLDFLDTYTMSWRMNFGFDEGLVVFINELSVGYNF